MWTKTTVVLCSDQFGVISDGSLYDQSDKPLATVGLGLNASWNNESEFSVFVMDTPDGDQGVRLTHVRTGKVLDCAPGTSGGETVPVLNDDSGSRSQRWYLEGSSGNQSLHCAANGLLLSVVLDVPTDLCLTAAPAATGWKVAPKVPIILDHTSQCLAADYAQARLFMDDYGASYKGQSRSQSWFLVPIDGYDNIFNILLHSPWGHEYLQVDEQSNLMNRGDPQASGFFFGVVEGLDKMPVALAWYGVHSPIICPLNQVSIRGVQEMMFKDYPELEPAVARAIALSLYLCAQNADIGHNGETQRPCNPEPTKTRHGLRTFPREQVRTWDVGSRVAAELRQDSGQGQATAAPADDEQTQRARPRPHTRRAHRHSYWIKNEDGERALISRWVGHINVNARAADDIIETVRPIPESGAPTPAHKKIRMH